MPESWSAKNRRLAKEKKQAEKAAKSGDAAPAGGGGTGKRSYTRRGPVCPVCKATMTVNAKTREPYCPFESSHAASQVVRTKGKNKAAETNRGGRTRSRGSGGPQLWKKRPDPKDGGEGSDS
jgi:hypothetical protein